MEIKRAHEHRLLQKKNVAGVGIGKKIIAGKQTDQDWIAVMVDQKVPPLERRTRLGLGWCSLLHGFDSGYAPRVCREKSMALFQGRPCLTFLGGIDSECRLDFESLYFLWTSRLIFFEAGLYLESAGTFEK